MEFIVIAIVIFFVARFLYSLGTSKPNTPSKPVTTINRQPIESEFEKSRRLQREASERESKRLAELNAIAKERNDILNSSYNYSEGSYSIYYLKPYYPVNRYPKSLLTEDEIQTRDLLYKFKDGISNEKVKRAFSILINNRIKSRNNLLCVIPASNPIRSKKRFETFIKELAASTEIENGYDAILNYHNLEPSHLTGNIGNNADKFYINQEKIRGKNVILIDDVITRGTSFKTLAAKLKALGAYEVTGLFICKTSYK